MNLLENLKGQKCKKPPNISKNSFFYKQIFDFHLSFQNCMPQIEIMKLCQSKLLVPTIHGTRLCEQDSHGIR